MRTNTAKRLKNMLLVGIFSSSLMLLIAVYVFASVKGYDAVALPPPNHSIMTPTGEYQSVSFPSRGQSYAVYAYYLPGKRGMPALINVHGYKGSRFSPDQIDRMGDLRDLGYTVLSIDLSDNAGDTVGNGRISMGYSERWDVLGGYDYLLAKGFAPEQIGVTGISMGAATILLAAAAEPRIRAIWADSAYARADVVIAEQAANDGLPTMLVPGGLLAGALISGDRIWDAAPVAAAADLATHAQAVYLVHCRWDTTVPFHHGSELFEAYYKAGVGVTFWDIPDCEHAAAIVPHHAEYLRRLDEFFRDSPCDRILEITSQVSIEKICIEKTCEVR